MPTPGVIASTEDTDLATLRRFDCPMPLDALTEDEMRIAHTCLECVAAGDVILHDREFHSIMGIDVQDLRSVLGDWPDVDDSETTVRLAINNSFNNLLGYPHAFQDNWESRIPVAKAEVARVFAKWKGDDLHPYSESIE